MSSNIAVKFKFGQFSAISRIEALSSLSSCFDFVVARWPECDGQKMKLVYSVGDFKDCLLENDDDFLNMLFVVSNLDGFKKLEIEVMLESSTDRSCFIVSEKVSGNGDPVCVDTADSVLYLCPDFVNHPKNELESTSWKSLISHVGQSFSGGAKELRESLVKYSSENGFTFQYVCNSSDKIIARCSVLKDSRCSWRLYATKEECNGYMYIRKLENSHTCGYIFNPKGKKCLGSDIVSDLILGYLRSNPKLTPKDVVSVIKEKYGHDITYKVAWTALEKARRVIQGSPTLSYDRIQMLLDVIKSEDPSTEVGYEYDPKTQTFLRCFIAFGASLRGFQYCRPMLFLDGTFLLNKFKGHLLSIVAKDGDQGLSMFS